MSDTDKSQTAIGEGPPAKSERSTSAQVWRRWQLWVILAAVVVTAIVVPLLAGRGSGFVTGSATLPAASTSRAASVRQGGTNTTSAATPEEAATTMKVPPKLQVKLRRWNEGSGGKALAAVSNDVGIALQAGGVKMFRPMRTACGSLTFAIHSAKAGPRIPNPALQQRYSTALTQLASGAVSCKAAISERASGDETMDTHENPALLRAAESHFSAGIKDLYRVTVEMAAAGR